MKGFTLIELIIVIVIIGILAAIAVPRFIDLSESAQRAQIQANAQAVQAAVNIAYAQAAVDGEAVFPENVTGDMFADGEVPAGGPGAAAAVGGYYWDYDNTTGSVTFGEAG